MFTEGSKYLHGAKFHEADKRRAIAEALAKLRSQQWFKAANPETLDQSLTEIEMQADDIRRRLAPFANQRDTLFDATVNARRFMYQNALKHVKPRLYRTYADQATDRTLRPSLRRHFIDAIGHKTAEDGFKLLPSVHQRTVHNSIQTIAQGIKWTLVEDLPDVTQPNPSTPMTEMLKVGAANICISENDISMEIPLQMGTEHAVGLFTSGNSGLDSIHTWTEKCPPRQ